MTSPRGSTIRAAKINRSFDSTCELRRFLTTRLTLAVTHRFPPDEAILKVLLSEADPASGRAAWPQWRKVAEILDLQPSQPTQGAPHYGLISRSVDDTLQFSASR
jgi:hypothetical protein